MASGKAPSWVCASLGITDTKVAASDANTARNDRQRTLAGRSLEYRKDAARHTSGFQEVWHLILADPEGLPLPGLVYSWRQQISCPEGTFHMQTNQSRVQPQPPPPSGCHTLGLCAPALIPRARPRPRPMCQSLGRALPPQNPTCQCQVCLLCLIHSFPQKPQRRVLPAFSSPPCLLPTDPGGFPCCPMGWALPPDFRELHM